MESWRRLDKTHFCVALSAVYSVLLTTDCLRSLRFPWATCAFLVIGFLPALALYRQVCDHRGRSSPQFLKVQMYDATLPLGLLLVSVQMLLLARGAGVVLAQLGLYFADLAAECFARGRMCTGFGYDLFYTSFCLLMNASVCGSVFATLAAFITLMQSLLAVRGQLDAFRYALGLAIVLLAHAICRHDAFVAKAHLFYGSDLPKCRSLSALPWF